MTRVLLRVLLLAAASLLVGCPRTKALRALGGAELVRVTGVELSADAVEGRVLVRWPGKTQAICIDQLTWEADGGLTLIARADAPCRPPSEGAAPEQWLRVQTTPVTVGALASATGAVPGSRSHLAATVDGFPVEAKGGGKPGFSLSQDFVVELGHSVGARSAKLEVKLTPPAVRVHVGVTNVLDRDLRTARCTWQVTVGDEHLRSGDLDVPAVLLAGEEFDVVVELDAADALAIATATVTGPTPVFTADLGLISPWGKVVLRSEFEL